MKSRLTNFLIIFLLISCSPETTRSVSNVPDTPTTTSTPNLVKTTQLSKTKTSTPTLLSIDELLQTPGVTIPTLTPTKRPTETPVTVCDSPANEWETYLSPDDMWISTMCRGVEGVISSHLKVTSVDGYKEWTIYYSDYANGTYYDRRNMIYPYRWSKDGHYLFVISYTTHSGCCWIGGDVLLVRLNLRTGQQTEVANYVVENPSGLSFSISADDRYFLSTPGTSLHILDMSTWEERRFDVNVENGSVGYPLMSLDSTRVLVVLREYPKERQGDLTFGSLVLIYLESDTQKKLLSGMDYHDTPVPVNWIDDENVLLVTGNIYWSLNVNTGELVETIKP